MTKITIESTYGETVVIDKRDDLTVQEMFELWLRCMAGEGFAMERFSLLEEGQNEVR